VTVTSNASRVSWWLCPAGVEHCPKATDETNLVLIEPTGTADETNLVLIEPTGTANTGNAGRERAGG
jgi:hypothetical protein